VSPQVMQQADHQPIVAAGAAAAAAAAALRDAVVAVAASRVSLQVR
jgi:hypothetical protein